MLEGLYFDFNGSIGSKEELDLHLKLGFKRLYRKFKDSVDIPPIPVLAKTLYDSLPNPGQNHCDENPIYLKHITSATLLAAWNLDEAGEEGQKIKSWIDAGILHHVAFPEPEKEFSLLPLPKGFLNPMDYKALIDKLIKSDSLWRLFVGANLQEVESPEHYEKRQPGVLKAMSEAFFVALKTLDKPLDFELLIKIRQACVKNVKGLELQKEELSSPYRTKDVPVGFAISTKGSDFNKSIAGYREACLYPDAGRDYIISSNRIGTKLYGDELESRIKKLLSAYHAKMTSTKDRLLQLQIMMETLGTIERIHPFYDVNCRTICVIALLRELIRYGFSPVILSNPNRFDCFSSKEMINELSIGYAYLEKVLAQEKHSKPKKDNKSSISL